MRFGPLETQACGENNFTMKALGILAFRPDLRARFVQQLVGPDVSSPTEDNVSMLFFSRVGEGFFREAVERERYGDQDSLEERLNATLDLPSGFRWRRNQDGRLTQPAKWQSSHIDEMLTTNGRMGDEDLRGRLADLQNCLNTEPDIVLQWDRRLALVEIKVLSSEGERQIERQISLGRLLSRLLDWEVPLFFLIGPEHGGRPTCPECRFFSWADVASWFPDVPDIVDYIRSFAFFYHGRWQSMITATATAPGQTAYDLMHLERVQESSAAGDVMPEVVYKPKQMSQGSVTDQWHFSHLGGQYFLEIFRGCKSNGVWPLRWIWVGTTGVPFAEKLNGRQINPNWMVEDRQGQRRTRSSGFGTRGQYNEGRMKRFSYDEIAQHFGLH